MQKVFFEKSIWEMTQWDFNRKFEEVRDDHEHLKEFCEILLNWTKNIQSDLDSYKNKENQVNEQYRDLIEKALARPIVLKNVMYD